MVIQILEPAQASLLNQVAPEVFDHPINYQLANEFLNDPRHHLAVAMDGNAVVGFASGVTYFHPDKPLELFVNEVGVAPTHQRQGIATRLMQALLEHARTLGCTQAWVLTEANNTAANRLYQALGGHKAEAVLYSLELG